MALTVRTYTSDGIRTIYPIDFDLGYIRQEFVYVYAGSDTEFETQLDYSWINTSQIELYSPLNAGESFKIRRVIPRDEPINDYEDGAVLRESNLDDSFVQALMILQEIEDGYLTTTGEVSFNSDINLLGNSLFNLVTKFDDPTSAITLGDADDRYINVTGDTLQGILNFGNHVARLVGDAVNDQDAVNLRQLISYINDRDISGTDVLPMTQGRQVANGTDVLFLSPASEYIAPEAFFVSIDGLLQRPRTDFNVEPDGKILFDEAPPIHSEVDVTLFKPDRILVGSGIGLVQVGYNGDGLNTTFTRHPDSSTLAHDQIVSIDGVLQDSEFDLTIVGNDIQFDIAPPSMSKIVIRSIKVDT